MEARIDRHKRMHPADVHLRRSEAAKRRWAAFHARQGDSKKCQRCKAVKSLPAFSTRWNRDHSARVRATYCNACVSLYARQCRAKFATDNPNGAAVRRAKETARRRIYVAANREKVKAYARNYAKRHHALRSYPLGAAQLAKRKQYRKRADIRAVEREVLNDWRERKKIREERRATFFKTLLAVSSL